MVLEGSWRAAEPESLRRGGLCRSCPHSQISSQMADKSGAMGTPGSTTLTRQRRPRTGLVSTAKGCLRSVNSEALVLCLEPICRFVRQY
jgi:hypothetical protein